MNNKIKILFFILAIILLFTPSTVLSDNRTIKVSQSKNPPLIFSDQEGNPQGIFVDIISEIASQEGWKLEFVPCTWSECQQKLETGELNLLMSVASSEERRAKFDFSEEQVFSNWGTIYRKSHSNLESIHDLEGEKIAVVKGNIHTKAFRNLLKEFSVESEIVEVKDYPDVAALVDAGNVSAGVFNRVNGLKYEGEFTLERTHIIFNPVKLLFASPKGKNHELLSIIDSTLKEWKKDQDSVYYESLNKWLGITPKRYIPKWLYFSLIIICGVLIISSGWTYVLRKQINERKKIEQALLQSKEEWEKTFNAITDIVTLQDLDMKIVKVNKTGCDTLGLPCENIIGKHCYELFHGSHEPCPGCPLLVTQETFEPYTKEMRHEKLGKTFLVSAAPVLDDQGNLTHITHVAKDITEKKKIEEQLFLNEKLATIAGLAAGVAHEINTPLSAILQSQQMIKMRLDPDKPRNQERAAECGVDLTKVDTYFKNNELDFFMKGMRDSAITAGNIIKNLLEFSRPHKGEIKNANLSNLLDTTLVLARADYDLKKQYDIINVEIIKEYDSELTEVPCVAMEFEQVILNLIKNAVHAMADNNTENPCITIRTVKTEKMARIEVEDNGPGIDKETQLHIFDPFFTTKEVGAGTGLGLSVSHALVVDKLKGNIWMESKPGKGAMFVVELPLSQDGC